MTVRVLLGLLVLAAPAAAAPPTVIPTGGPSTPSDPKVTVVAGNGKLAGKRSTRREREREGRQARTTQVAKGSAKPWRRAATADLSSGRRAGMRRRRRSPRLAHIRPGPALWR